MVLRITGKWHLYYTAHPGNKDCDYMRTDVTTLPVAAPEVFQHEGQWFLAALLPTLTGIQLTRLEWASSR